MSPLQRWANLLPLIALSVVIVVASSQPVVLPQPIMLADKFYHYVGYLVYGMTIVLAMRSFQLSVRQRLVWGIAFGLLFAASDEIHQAFVPGRNADVFDWCADALGILTAFTLAAKRKRHAHA